MEKIEFNPDGQCKQWCFNEILKHYNLSHLKKIVCYENVNLINSLSVLNSTGFKTALYLPFYYLINPKIFYYYFKYRHYISFQNISMNENLYFIISEVDSFSFYQIDEIWNHAILLKYEFGNINIYDNMRDILLAEGYKIPTENQYYINKGLSSHHPKLYIWREK